MYLYYKFVQNQGQCSFCIFLGVLRCANFSQYSSSFCPFSEGLGMQPLYSSLGPQARDSFVFRLILWLQLANSALGDKMMLGSKLIFLAKSGSFQIGLWRWKNGENNHLSFFENAELKHLFHSLTKQYLAPIFLETIFRMEIFEFGWFYGRFFPVFDLSKMQWRKNYEFSTISIVPAVKESYLWWILTLAWQWEVNFFYSPLRSTIFLKLFSRSNFAENDFAPCINYSVWQTTAVFSLTHFQFSVEDRGFLRINQ